MNFGYAPVADFMKDPYEKGAFTDGGCSCGKEVTHEVLVTYCECVATKTMR